MNLEYQCFLPSVTQCPAVQTVLWLFDAIVVAVHQWPSPDVSVKYSLPMVVAGITP